MSGILAPASAKHIARPQHRASTSQDPDIASRRRAPRLSTLPDSLPAGMEQVAMSTTTAVPSSPSARGGAWTWLRRWWRGEKHASIALDGLSIPSPPATATVHHFREFTVSPRLQSGGGPLRARAFGQRAAIVRPRSAG